MGEKAKNNQETPGNCNCAVKNNDQIGEYEPFTVSVSTMPVI